MKIRTLHLREREARAEEQEQFTLTFDTAGGSRRALRLNPPAGPEARRLFLNAAAQTAAVELLGPLTPPH